MRVVSLVRCLASRPPHFDAAAAAYDASVVRLVLVPPTIILRLSSIDARDDGDVWSNSPSLFGILCSRRSISCAGRRQFDLDPGSLGRRACRRRLHKPAVPRRILVNGRLPAADIFATALKPELQRHQAAALRKSEGSTSLLSPSVVPVPTRREVAQFPADSRCRKVNGLALSCRRMMWNRAVCLG